MKTTEKNNPTPKVGTMFKRILMTVTSSLSFVVGFPLAAQAATVGGYIYNWCQSDTSIRVLQTNGYYRSVPACQSSASLGIKDVQSFWVPNGYVAKNLATGYRYSGGVWHPMCCDNTHINFDVIYVG